MTELEEDLDMADITTDAPNRFVLVNDDGDQLHIFRVPAGTVIHIASGAPEDGANADPHPVLAMLIDDESAPFVLKALARMSNAEVTA